MITFSNLFANIKALSFLRIIWAIFFWVTCSGLIQAQITNSLFGEQHLFVGQSSKPYCVHASDLDNDGDMDVLSTSYEDDKVVWYKNKGNNTWGAVQHVIDSSALGAKSVYTADLDNDGYTDVLLASSSNHTIACYRNKGENEFGNRQVIFDYEIFVKDVHAADLDNDGDIDVLSASWTDDAISWYSNDGTGHFGERQIITILADGAISVYTADLDNDGDIDVLSGSSCDKKVAWYENDGNGNFGEQQIIITNAGSITSVYATDLNLDGAIDVLFASESYDKVAWYENDGTGNFNEQHIISTNADGIKSVYAADLDNDGDIDVLSASYNDDKIAWYENNGNGNFGEQQIITTLADGAASVYTADLDNDGDLDVLSSSTIDNKVAWYENLIFATAVNPINGASEIAIQISPNPAHNQITLSFNAPIAVSTRIILNNVSGKPMAVYNNPSGNKTITISQPNLPTGLYFLQVQDANNHQILSVSKVIFE